MKKLITTTAPALLILLFAYAVMSKLADLPEFRHEMHNQNFPPAVAEALLYAVPAAELLAIGLLLSNRLQEKGLLWSTLLLAAFTGYIGLAMAGYWERMPCSCGGVLRNMSWTAHFLFNLCFLALSAAALFIRIKEPASVR